MTMETIATPNVVVTKTGTIFKYTIWAGDDVVFADPTEYSTYAEAASKGRHWINRAYEENRLPYYGDN